MGFEIPSREALHDEFIQDYADRNPDKSVSRGSDPWRISRTLSAVLWAGLARLLFFLLQALPDTATGEYLLRWGEKIFQFPKLGPKAAAADQSLTITGTPLLALPDALQLSHTDGTLFQVKSTGVILDGGGSAVVDVIALTPGVIGNKVAGEKITFISPPIGLDAEATVTAKLKGGLNNEEQEPYRARLLDHIGDPPEGGAVHDYVEWLKRTPGVSQAYVWAHRRGMGTMDIAGLGPGNGPDRALSDDDRSAIEDYVARVRPGGARDFLVLQTTPQTADVTTRIEIDEDRFRWDWDDAETGYPITAHDEGARTITVPTIPDAVVPGKRLTVLGEEARVTARVGTVLTLSFENDDDGNPVVWFSFAVTTQDVRASGDLVVPVRKAIIALINRLGPARSKYSKTSWTADLRTAKLFAAITDVDGCDDALIDTPGANVVPVDTFGTSVPYLVPGVIQVWKGAF